MIINPNRKPMRVVSYSSVLKARAAQSAKDADESKASASNGSKKTLPVKCSKKDFQSSSSTSVQQILLKATMRVFKQLKCDKLKTRDLIANLCSDPSKKWSTYNKGKEITARQLGGLLKPYGITSHDLYYPEGCAKGYFRNEIRKAYKQLRAKVMPIRLL